MNLAYSFFFYLSYVAPAYCVIFHPSIAAAPEKARNFIHDATNSLESIAEDNDTGLDLDDADMYLTATARNLFGNPDNQDIGLRKSLFITTWIETTPTRCQFPLITAVDLSSHLNANKTTLIERAHNLLRVNYAITELESAIGVDPIMFVYGLGHLTLVPDHPSIVYDDWANVGIPTDANFQRCARTAGPGENLVMASTFVVGGINGPTLSYIIICADGQAWIHDILAPLTVYEILQQQSHLLNQLTVDYFQTLDFALLTQILDTPMALNRISATASANEVSGYAACVRAKDPYNAGT